MSRSLSSPLIRIWAWPLGLALLTACGLISALVSDGAGEVWAWFSLGLPVATMAWHGLRRAGTRPPAADSLRDNPTLSSHT